MPRVSSKVESILTVVVFPPTVQAGRDEQFASGPRRSFLHSLDRVFLAPPQTANGVKGLLQVFDIDDGFIFVFHFRPGLLWFFVVRQPRIASCPGDKVEYSTKTGGEFMLKWYYKIKSLKKVVKSR
jgi:hypothetical protein